MVRLLLWLAICIPAFGTPFTTADPVAALGSNRDSGFAVFSLGQLLDDPKQALEDLCRESDYFLVLPDPPDPDDDSVLDFGDIRPTFACYHKACETSSL